MKEPSWIRQEALIALHGISLSRFGGAAGVRDAGLLESALARPQNRFHYEATVALHDLAASYAFGIAKNHPFVDGNKRAAYLAADLFLRRNGVILKAPQPESYKAIMELAGGVITEEQFSSWLKKFSYQK
jgi:death-on-curing protein